MDRYTIVFKTNRPDELKRVAERILSSHRLSDKIDLEFDDSDGGDCDDFSSFLIMAPNGTIFYEQKPESNFPLRLANKYVSLAFDYVRIHSR